MRALRFLARSLCASLRRRCCERRHLTTARGFAAAIAAIAILAGAVNADTFGPPSYAPITGSLGSDVALSNVFTYFNGPSTSQGTTGTFTASGSVTVQDTAGAATVLCKLWDGTNNPVAIGQISTNAANSAAVIALSGSFSSPAGNIRIDCKDASSTSGKMMSTLDSLNNASTLTVRRVY